jgi:UDP-glucuronate 4-epimerase
MTWLVTGAAGFIGSHAAHVLLDRGEKVIGLDNLNDYYDVRLKEARLERLTSRDGFTFHKASLEDKPALTRIFEQHNIKKVIHLAAQAGVRYSIENPDAYIQANIVGFQHMIDLAKEAKVEHFVYASSSSVYGSNEKMPFATADSVDHPVSLYAATKKANELVAHTYSHLYDLPTTGLRFFTVYGPWGRPDMSLFLFTRKIIAGEPIDVFNHGKHRRDFTYIDDIVDGVIRVADNTPTANPDYDPLSGDPAASHAPYRVYNIGNNKPVELMTFIETIEKHLGLEAKKNFLPLQPGDVPATYADIEPLRRDTGFEPRTSIDEGIGNFIDWYRTFYN